MSDELAEKVMSAIATTKRIPREKVTEDSTLEDLGLPNSVRDVVGRRRHVGVLALVVEERGDAIPVALVEGGPEALDQFPVRFRTRA